MQVALTTHQRMYLENKNDTHTYCLVRLPVYSEMLTIKARQLISQRIIHELIYCVSTDMNWVPIKLYCNITCFSTRDDITLHCFKSLSSV